MCGTLYMEYKYDISVRKNGGCNELSGGIQKTGKIRTASCAEILRGAGGGREGGIAFPD